MKEAKIDRFVVFVFGMLFLIPALVYILFFAKILIEGIPVISWSYLTSAQSSDLTAGGIGTVITGTLATVFLMLLFVIPFGVITALYLSEYSINRAFDKFFLFMLYNLSGVPSVVFGIFGLGFFVLNIGSGIDNLLGLDLVFGRPSMLWAAFTLAFMLVPMVTITSYQSFKAVPESYRETAYGAGANKFQMVRRVLIPHSISGVFTGIILSVSRAVGETAPLLFLGCAFFLPSVPVFDLCISGFCLPLINPTEQFLYLSYNIFILSTQSTAQSATIPYQYAGTLVLIFLTIICNGTTIFFRQKFRKTVRTGEGE
ncbi:phosphate ABC transporter permease PstA [Ignavibacteriales bacterium]